MNNTSSSFFPSSRDPLSPYLFVLAMEAVNCLLRKVRDGDFLFGFKVNGRDELEVSHLLFGDNTLVLYEASLTQMTDLSWLLMWFKVISSLKINLIKSKLIPVGRMENLDGLAFESTTFYKI